MANEYRCFHSRTPEEQEPDGIDPDMILEGVVACQHVYGIGVYVPEQEVWGHVNVTAMGVARVRENFVDHPAIGTHLRLQVLGRTPNGQLRLAVI
ncbi:hypothetical protein [Terrabacter sp. Soil810]|uniref:hypothetical protein n=1 Tax=Terrabacter sp. Soil810 TaxID=1736418 RepID=UPI00070E084B|nr:hypothetical protein [Terrabacter sp. Soil810]KRF40696.1 hypothetical protein ASG96_07575 [Terrabacter sp. Soil810]